MSDDKMTPSMHLNEQSLLKPSIQLWKHYLLDQGRSIHTVKAFVADLNLLDAFLPADKQIGTITTKDLEGFTHWLEKERNVPCSPKSLARRITSIKSFFRWLSQFRVISNDPTEKLVQLTVISPLPVVLTQFEYQRVLDHANALRYSDKPDARPFTLLALILETAIKKGECLALMTNHIEAEPADSAHIYVRYTNPRYRYKERKLPVSATWVDAYQEYLEQYQLQNEVFPWSPRRLEYIFEDIGDDIGLDKHLSFDMCRWTSALQDLVNGVEPDKIRQKLGVSKIQWREVNLKLRKLAKQQGLELTSQESETEA